MSSSLALASSSRLRFCAGRRRGGIIGQGKKERKERERKGEEEKVK
jgi:hypothetical protein